MRSASATVLRRCATMKVVRVSRVDASAAAGAFGARVRFGARSTRVCVCVGGLARGRLLQAVRFWGGEPGAGGPGGSQKPRRLAARGPACAPPHSLNPPQTRPHPASSPPGPPKLCPPPPTPKTHPVWTFP
jgi:hypothetical protein